MLLLRHNNLANSVSFSRVVITESRLALVLKHLIIACLPLQLLLVDCAACEGVSVESHRFDDFLWEAETHFLSALHKRQVKVLLLPRPASYLSCFWVGPHDKFRRAQ